jgi:hypothetical protein
MALPLLHWLCCSATLLQLCHRCSATNTALLLLRCRRRPAALPPCHRLCAAAAALMQTLPLPCCLRCHCSAVPSNANVLPPCHHDHVLILCAEHASHLHLSNLPIYLFCAADSRTIQNQNFVCHPNVPHSHCAVHHASTPSPDLHPLLPGQPSGRLPTSKPTIFLLFV